MHGTISHFSKTTKLALRPRQFFLNFNYVAGTSRAVDKEARSLLYKYMGDLYRDATDTIGEPSHGAGSELGGGIRLRIQGSLLMHPVAVQA